MYLLFCLFICVSVSLAEVSIKYTAIIHAHGDTIPVDTYPTDPWRNESMWRAEFGKLTSIGKRQEYALGKWFGERYLNMTSKRCDPQHIYARSIDAEPALMSAQANLAGMCLQHTENLSDKYLSQQPIFIHTIPKKDDEILAMKKECSQYSKIKSDYINSKEYEDRLNNYKGLMDYLTVHTNRTIENYEDINEIYNILYIENLYNFTLPNWTQAVFPHKLKDPACYSYTMSTATPPMARLMVGPLIKEIVNNMSTTTSTKSNAFTVSLYSGSDFTVGNVLSALGLFDGNCPPSSASILMELLYDNSTNDYFVRILYRNTTAIVEPYTLFIPNCGKTCELSKFIEIYNNLKPLDWEAECKEQNGYNNTVLIIVITVIIIVIPLGTFLNLAYLIFAMPDDQSQLEYIGMEDVRTVMNPDYNGTYKKFEIFDADLDSSVRNESENNPPTEDWKYHC